MDLEIRTIKILNGRVSILVHINLQNMSRLSGQNKKNLASSLFVELTKLLPIVIALIMTIKWRLNIVYLTTKDMCLRVFVCVWFSGGWGDWHGGWLGEVVWGDRCVSWGEGEQCGEIGRELLKILIKCLRSIWTVFVYRWLGVLLFCTTTHLFTCSIWEKENAKEAFCYFYGRNTAFCVTINANRHFPLFPME